MLLKETNSKKIKSYCINIIKKRGAINRNYTYIVFGKSNAYSEKHDVLLSAMIKSFNKIK